MKHIIKTLIVVMVIVLTLAVFTACGEDPVPTTPAACEHAGGTATCTEAAVCEKCGESYGEKAEHTVVTQNGKEVTCTEDGITEGKYCSVCMEVIVSQEVIPHEGHKEVIDEMREPTCTEKGLTEGKHCSVCDEVLVEQKEIKENGHTEVVDEAVAATCTEAGKTAGKHCSVCNEVLVAQTVVDALGHTEVVDAAVAADCDSTGLTEGKHCSVCGEVLIAQEVVAALGHTEEVIAAKAPTCTETGLTEGKKCSVCGEILVAQTRVSPLGHTEETVAGTAATCTETGLTDGKKCSVCGETLIAQEVVPAAGHKDENGDYECDVCETDLCTDHVPADAVEENRVESTCTVAGSYESVVKCANCGEEISRETKALPLADHTEEVIPAVEPDCVNTGLTEGKKCSVCGEITVAQEVVNAYGHEESVLSGKEATCAEAGLTEGKKCTVCGETTVAQEEIPALGHAYELSYLWSADELTCTATKVCGNDATHTATETLAPASVTLNVTATKVTYTYNYAFAEGTYTQSVEEDVTLTNSIATINAREIAGRTASHEYVKFGFHDAAATYTFTIYYSEVDVWDGTSVSTSLAGSGTAEDPYLVQSGADLAYIAKVVNDAAKGATNFKGQYFKMTKSINLNGNELKIGGYTAGKVFHGYFDGNNCAIKGINATQSLFGMLIDGYIKNLSTYGTVTTTEAKGVAGLVSYLQNATVENITNYVNVTGIQQVAGVVGWLAQDTVSYAINCVNYGNINATSYQIGGIAGFAKGTITGCTNFGDVTSTANSYIGGIGGASKDAKGTLSDCVNYGNISGKSYVGGVFGMINKTATNCYSYGTATGTTTTSIGEVVGSGASYLKYTE
ncbi:MAG: hypothetical protein IKA84_05120 [Clostridia bacterium]|nr:hypothetical protein [Clostridia bacterium]